MNDDKQVKGQVIKLLGADSYKNGKFTYAQHFHNDLYIRNR